MWGTPPHDELVRQYKLLYLKGFMEGLRETPEQRELREREECTEFILNLVAFGILMATVVGGLVLLFHFGKCV